MTRSGHLRETVTRATVARRASVSPAVVSYVLNDGPRPVARLTRERVLKAIDELGYRPNAVARALKQRRTHTIGLVVPDISNPFFAELAKAIEDVAYSLGYAVILGNSSNDEQRETVQLRTLSDRQVDGLLIVGASAHPDLSVLRNDGLPVVLLDRSSHDFPYPSVVVDNPGGAREGVEHLFWHGHSRIACIAGPKELPEATDREFGWRQALDAHGLASKGMLSRAPFSRQGGYDAARHLLAQSLPPTAIFASSDLQGIGALRACHEVGLGVPNDVALIAFDGTQESEFTTPPLSVIRQPITSIAETAIRVLQSEDTDDGLQQFVLPFDLVLRRSCGCDAP